MEIAKELARVYLTSYRLGEAAPVIERWRSLAPDDPQPYMWANEIASRSDSSPSILIRNYRAALERDPNLDKARLGLAEQLSKDRRFEEAEQEFRTYLERRPKDTAALVGLGRNAFQAGDMEAARRHFEAASASTLDTPTPSRNSPSRTSVSGIIGRLASDTSFWSASTLTTIRSIIPTRKR